MNFRKIFSIKNAIEQDFKLNFLTKNGDFKFSQKIYKYRIRKKFVILLKMGVLFRQITVFNFT